MVRSSVCLALGMSALLVGCGDGSADEIDRGPGPTEEASKAPPAVTASFVFAPTNSTIVDPRGAVILGKALFWDIQLGGDGQIACATCHAHAGADARRLNTINPGPNGLFEDGSVSAAGQLLGGGSLPLSSDDIVGSQGIASSTFVSVATDPNVAADQCVPTPAPPFGANRRVTGRNAPSVVGAVFMRDLFWDGRASHVFNGADPFGLTGNAGGVLSPTMNNASLASQAVGPANNATEVSCAGRAFNGPSSLATKLVDRQALHFQDVNPTDGVLGTLSASPARGLRCGGVPCTYRKLIEVAFGKTVAADANNRFSRVWGEAIQAYEATLIPNATPFDRFASGDRSALTSSQQDGLNIFQGKGHCARCHAGSEFTDASLSFFAEHGPINDDGGDQGFHNIGVRPTAEDLGRAGTGPFGVSFSVSGAAADRGAFKTPSLRNVGLTSPYFHDGRFETLSEVVGFYSRGGDFKNAEQSRRIEPVNFDDREKARVVDFLANGLTDCRTRMERAPFDHPALPLPNGTDVPAVGAAGIGNCP